MTTISADASIARVERAFETIRYLCKVSCSPSCLILNCPLHTALGDAHHDLANALTVLRVIHPRPAQVEAAPTEKP